MKNRSHRLPVSDPLDDWVDGSWTVDCVCGVNFDDGEEMVNCDECGVWVHTRCSRYVKSEKSFACDKCKSKNSRNVEETEVAQLLVELPTKTLRMDNPNPPSGSGPPRRPFRLWTDIPMEERVHVQGVPGGDPALFGGFSSVFSPELWKCTGYVPKKFNFQYREFPCWDEKQGDDKKSDEEHENLAKRTDAEQENPANKGAGVLFSLSKENVLPTPVATLVDTKRQVEGGCDRLTPSNGTKKQEREDLNVRRPQNGVKKDRSLLQPIVIYSGKRKKEVSETSKDRSGKKKARGVDKEGESKKRGAHASKSVSTLSSDAKQLEFYEDSATKVVKIVTQSSKHGNSRGTMPADSLSDGYRVSDSDAGDHRKNLAVSGQHSETSSFGVSRHNSSIEVRPVEENGRHQVSARLEISSKTDDGASSLLEHNDSGSVPIKEEVPVDDLDNLNDTGGGSNRNEGIDPHKSDPLEDLGTTAPEVKDYQNFQASNGDRSSSSLQPNFELKAVDIDNSGGVSNVQPSLPSDVKLESMEPLAQHPGISADHLSENVKVTDSAVASLQSSDHKVEDVDKSTVVSVCQTGKADESPGDPCQPMQQLLGSESSMAVRKSSSELKRGSRLAEEPSKSGSKILSPPVPPNQRKMVVSIGKSSSTSSTIVISKPSVSDIRMPANLQNHSSSTTSKKNNVPTDVVRNEDGRERPKKLAKELSKSSFSSVLKTSHSSKFSHASVSKRTLSDPNESVICSSKTSSVQKNAATPDTGESASSLQTESVLHVQNKITASGLPHRGEKINLPNCQPSSKVNHAPPTNPPAPSNSLATLSDEELALLLHQELNSSPRVPRVPRMRHAGSLPQLASPTATSMLMKRTSSSGGKDHGLVSKRKNKDLAKDGLRNSREFDDEAKKVDRVPSLPDHSRHDLDPVMKVEADSRSGKGSHSVSRSIPPTTTLSSGPSSSTEANEQNMSSPRNASDDDTGTVGRPTHRTLPGLIAEIMSKGKRMTYEELCNAVLPHWPNLRKHNGERYAYSSHSQAVLDCLRNRSEWARLVDRGPKTNASRKRRKLDAEPSSFESEGNEYSKDISAKDVESKSFESHRDEFPKGKRKARKRRRLALQGRGIKDVRRRHKADVLSDDDIDSFSNSTEETVFSEDEILGGGGVCSVGCEASASSDETGTML